MGRNVSGANRARASAFVWDELIMQDSKRVQSDTWCSFIDNSGRFIADGFFSRNILFAK